MRLLYWCCLVGLIVIICIFSSNLTNVYEKLTNTGCSSGCTTSYGGGPVCYSKQMTDPTVSKTSFATCGYGDPLYRDLQKFGGNESTCNTCPTCQWCRYDDPVRKTKAVGCIPKTNGPTCLSKPSCASAPDMVTCRNTKDCHWIGNINTGRCVPNQ